MSYKLTLIKSIFILFLFFVLQIVFGTINGILDDLFNIGFNIDLGLLFVYITLFAYYFSKYKISFKQLFGRISCRDLALYLVFFISVMIISTAIKFFGSPVRTVIVKQAQAYTSSLELLKDIFTLLSLVLIIPTMEEILFRGLIFKGIMNKYNFQVALLISSMLFAIIHTFTDIRLFLGLFLSGICFGTVFYLTKNIFYSILGHIIHNLLTSIFAYISRHYSANGLVAFGGEGLIFNPIVLVISLVVFLVLLIYITVYRYRKPPSDSLL